jgi:diacylglycerol kinase-like protein
MRITLMHNPNAGHGAHKKELMDALAKCGHQVIYQSTEKSNYKEALETPTDLVIAAGGDGTIEKIASRLIYSHIPLSVLPLGTANNLGRSLGFVASAQEISPRLQGGKERAFDVGLALGMTFGAVRAANEPRELSVSNLAADSQIALLSILFLAGVVFLLGSFGISGWMRSRLLGIAMTSLALIGAVAVFAALRPFLHVVSTP